MTVSLIFTEALQYSNCVKLFPIEGYRWRFVMPPLMSHFSICRTEIIVVNALISIL
jgi:hypothetical protein